MTDIHADCPESHPNPGTPVYTACGARIAYSNAIPCLSFLGQPAYFCCEECKQEALENPRTSCMSTLYSMEFD